MKLIALLAALVIATASGNESCQPIAWGKITYYDCSSHCGKITRSGEPYDPASFTIAVDDDLWEEWAGELVRVTNLETGNALILRVNDTGYLSENGVAGDLPESVWSLISGRPLSEGVFQGLIERFDQG
ncbi:MAG TPA: hypothetical protein DCP08_06865 [Chloroflexi bacterium]|nr:hypothetical protein [Chloroflexota bacterium]